MSYDIGGIAQFHLSQASASQPRGGDPVKQVAREFEALFLSQLLSVMREGMGEDGLFEGTTGQDIYTSMMDQALARALAERGGIGLAETVYQQLKELDAHSARRGIGAIGSPAVDSRHDAGADLSGVVRDSRLSSGVGWRRDPFSGDWRYHRGVDLAAPEGTRVKSLTAGRVVFSGPQGGFGNTIVVENDRGTRVRYAHLRDIKVKEGEEVAQGQGIGSVGSTGRATGPHLHIEVESRGRLVDPLRFQGAFDNL
jgi:murein DD-endopeptidase MepM/ murein hydrolase activator NlpD